MDYFAPAHRLYGRFGFARCAPFADYAEDPNSVFMTRELD
jgi:putative acetyltransferase